MSKNIQINGSLIGGGSWSASADLDATLGDTYQIWSGGRCFGYGRANIEENPSVVGNGEKVTFTDHHMVRWIDFSKMTACVKEGPKMRYRRVEINTIKKFVSVFSPIGDSHFGDAVYNQYVKYCNDLVVK